MSAIEVPGLMCDNTDGCDQYDLDPSMGGLIRPPLLPQGWTSPEPGTHLCRHCSTQDPRPEVSRY